MGQKSQKQDTSSRSGNDAHVNDADIRPIIMKSQWLSLNLGNTGLGQTSNQSVVRQPTAFKSERPRISKPRFASQVDVNTDLSNPVTTHHLPKGRNLPLQNLITRLHQAHLSQEMGSTGKTFASSTTKVESEPQSSNQYPQQCESEQALNCHGSTTLSTADQASYLHGDDGQFTSVQAPVPSHTRVGITIPPSNSNG
ncbi:hypothetical protein Tco_0010174 [Tanacetum coccineum]